MSPISAKEKAKEDVPVAKVAVADVAVAVGTTKVLIGCRTTKVVNTVPKMRMVLHTMVRAKVAKAPKAVDAAKAAKEADVASSMATAIAAVIGAIAPSIAT